MLKVFEVYLSEVVLVLEHAFARDAIWMPLGFLVVLIASILSSEGASAMFALPIIFRVAVPLVPMGSAGVHMLNVAILRLEPAIAGIAIVGHLVLRRSSCVNV
jgi:hypothetical protein